MSDAQVIKIGVHSVAVGCDWVSPSSGNSTTKEIASIAKSKGSNFGAVLKTESFDVVGIHSSEGKGLPSGAAWLSQNCMGQHVILIEGIEDEPNKSWLCILNNGSPVLDVVCENVELDELIRTSKYHDDYKVYSKTYYYEGAESLSFLDLIKEEDKPQLIRQIRGIDPKLAIIGVAIVVVFGGGFGGYAFYTNHKKEQARLQAIRASSLQEEQRRIETERIKASNAQKTEQYLKSEVLDQAVASEQIRLWMETIERLPLNVGGWVPSNAKCSVSSCDVKYSRKKYGTISDFISESQAKGWVISEWTNDECTIRFDLSSVNRSGNIQEIASNNDFLPIFVSGFQRLQMIGLQFDVVRPVDLVVPDIEPLPPEVEVKNVHKIGTFTFKGDSLAYLGDLSGFVNFKNVAISQFTADLIKYNWVLEGKYVVAN